MRLLLIDVALLGLIGGGLWLAPWKDPAARRQLLWLLLLPLPAVAMLVFGPIVLFRYPTGAFAETLSNAQYLGMGVSAAVAIALVAALPKLRWTSLALGAVAVFCALAVGGANQIIMTPGS